MTVPRAPIVHVEQDKNGTVRQGAAITIKENDNATLIGQTMWDDPTPGQGNVLTNPLSTNGNGVAQAFVGVPQNVWVQPAGGTSYPSRFDVDPASLWTVSIRQFKALAGNGQDDSAAFNLANATLAASGGGTILLPGGPSTVYGIGAQVTLASNVHVYAHRATIKRVNGYTGTLFTSTDPTLTNITFEGVIFDNNQVAKPASVQRVLVLPNGQSNIICRKCEFIGFSYPNLIEVQVGALRSDGFWLDRCKVIRTIGSQVDGGGLTLENTQTIMVQDCSNVVFERTRFKNCNGIGIAGSTANAVSMQNVVIERNGFTGIHCTSLFIQVGGVVATIENILVNRNSWIDCGLDVEKGPLDIGANSTLGTVRGIHITSNTFRGWGYNGSSGGAATPNTGGAITIGGNLVDDIEISGNTIDARSSAGVPPAGKNYGINMGLFTLNGRIFGNTVRYCGLAGIQLFGGTSMLNIPIHDVAITGNTIESCMLNAATSTDDQGGIYIGEYCHHISINGNISRNNGSSDATALVGGIVVQHSPTISYINLNGNICYDSQTPKTQQFGIRVGVPGADVANRPTDVVVSDNILYDNVVAGLSYDNTASGTYFIYQNPGAAAGSGPPLDGAIQNFLNSANTANALGTVNAGLTASQDVSVAGAIVGDYATVTHSAWTATQTGLILHASVMTGGTVRVMCSNVTAGNIATPAGNLRVRVWHM